MPKYFNVSTINILLTVIVYGWIFLSRLSSFVWQVWERVWLQLPDYSLLRIHPLDHNFSVGGLLCTREARLNSMGPHLKDISRIFCSKGAEEKLQKVLMQKKKGGATNSQKKIEKPCTGRYIDDKTCYGLQTGRIAKSRLREIVNS